MRIIIRRAIAILAFLVLGSFSGCGADRSSQRSITLGAVLPLTGPIASYGKNAKDGIDLAVREINETASFKIHITYEDDRGEARNAVSATQKLISVDRVPLIIGEASSGYSLAIAPICNENKVVLISPISSAAELSVNGGPFFFRVCPSDAFQARFLAQWLIGDSITAVALLFVNSNWGISLRDEFRDRYGSMGGVILATESCEEGDRDFRSQLTKISNPRARAIVAFTPPKEGGPLVRQAREMGIRLPLFGGDFWGMPEFLESAGEAATGVFFCFPASPSGPLFEDFAAKYRAQYQNEPDVYASYSYDLVHIVANALKSGARSGSEIREYLRTMDTYEGVTGPTRFDEHGDVTTKTFETKTILKNGEYSRVK